MNLLAFDTSTSWLSVAVARGADVIEHEEEAGTSHSSRLVPTIDRLLGEAALSLHDLDAIAFGAGPGAFTGVRIACGVAQGLGLGADVRLVPVSTLEAVAQSAWRTHGTQRVLACLDARMREVYVAAFERRDEGWHAVMPEAVLPPSQVSAPEPASAWFGAGDGFAAYADLASTLRLVGCDATIRPRARALLDLASARIARGDTVDAADALPLYVRHRVALTTAERDAGARM